MHRFTYTAAALAAAISVASATPVVLPKGGFSVTQTRGNEFVKYGPLAMAKTYNKFGIPLPENLLKAIESHAIQKRVNGSIENTPLQMDLAYVSEVQIGTPPQTIPLDFDTGSADLWVSGPLTSFSSGQTTYNPSTSNTSTMSTNMWSITYGDGSSASGNVFTDVVSVGGVTSPMQAVEVANIESSSFLQQTDYSGLLGLAFSSINQAFPTKETTFFENVKSSLTKPVFTADLKSGKPGTYDFGYVDATKYTGDITYTPVDSRRGFWQFNSSGFQVGADQAIGFQSTEITGIADTGTTLLYLPTAVVKAYYDQVEGSENSQNSAGYVFPCSAKLPDFTFGVGDTMMNIPNAYLNYAPDDSSIGFSIFGDIALKAAFVVFDGSSTPQLGWAKKTL